MFWQILFALLILHGGTHQTTGQYYSISSGTCPSPITSSSDCNAAAVALGKSDTSASTYYTTSYPRGCNYYSGSSPLRFNSYSSSKICSSTFSCLCKGTISTTAAIQGDYYSMSSGSCPSPITSASDCNAAAVALGKSDTYTTTTSTDFYPRGCSYYSSGTLRFNSYTSSTTTCSSTYSCLCKPTISTTTAAAATIAPRSDYYEVSSGTCPSPITSQLDCNAAAVALGKSDTYASWYSTTSSYPRGCSYYYSGTLRFNSYSYSTTTCSSTYLCLCKPTISTTAVTTTTPPSYYSSSSGTCPSPITTVSDCNAAAVALGKADTYSSSYYTSSYPPGCSYSDSSGALRFNSYSSSTTTCSSFSCLCKPLADATTPLFYTVVSASCASPITTLSDCNAAASALGYSDTTSASRSSSTYAPGCSYDSYYNGLVFNSYASSSCSSTYPCLCKAVAPQIYYVKSEEKCLMSISSQADCNDAAFALGFTSPSTTSYTSYTHNGCINTFGSQVEFNSMPVKNPVDCSYTTPCICKANASSAYNVRTSGTCKYADTRIDSLEECSLAASVLGTTITSSGVHTGYTGGHASGCYYDAYDNSLGYYQYTTATQCSSSYPCICRGTADSDGDAYPWWMVSVIVVVLLACCCVCFCLCCRKKAEPHSPAQVDVEPHRSTTRTMVDNVTSAPITVDNTTAAAQHDPLNSDSNNVEESTRFEVPEDMAPPPAYDDLFKDDDFLPPPVDNSMHGETSI